MTCVTNSSFDINTEALEVAAFFPDSIRGRTILITGVNKSGIGFATAEAFASQSPRCLILAGRSPEKIQECVGYIKEKTPNIDVHPLLVDLSSQKSVRAAAAQVLSWTDVPAIHIVVNNAGIMRHGDTYGGPVPMSEDGIELMFATNHLGHFLLTNLIMPKIISGAKSYHSKGSARIINLTSSGTWISPLRASDLDWQKPATQLPEEEKPNFPIMKQAGMQADEHVSYIPTAAYGHSKTCNILFSAGLNQRLYEKYAILSLSLNPGEVRTELSRNTDSEWLERAIKKREEMGLMHWKTTGGGASTTLVAACDPKLTLPEDDGTGQYLDNCAIARAPPFAVNKRAANRLWQLSETLTKEIFCI